MEEIMAFSMGLCLCDQGAPQYKDMDFSWEQREIPITDNTDETVLQ